MTLTHPYKGHYMESAFLGFVSFASKELLSQFEAECGEINLATDGIGKMIDKATGHDISEAQRFMDWCVVQFGTPEQLNTHSEEGRGDDPDAGLPTIEEVAGLLCDDVKEERHG